MDWEEEVAGRLRQLDTAWTVVTCGLVTAMLADDAVFVTVQRTFGQQGWTLSR